MGTDTMPTIEQRAEALVGLALAEYVDAEHRKREEAEMDEKGRRLRVADAARAVAEALFGQKASDLLEWKTSPVDAAPAQVAEATVQLPVRPYSVRLVFRGWMDDDFNVMTESGALFVRRECYSPSCERNADHITPVASLAELGAVLTDHAAYDLDQGHGRPATPKEWSEPYDPRNA